jgi:type VI secretion system protein ImpK
MSDPNDPFGAFGSGGERTVIRPNPGGRRPAPPPGAAPRPGPPPGSSAQASPVPSASSYGAASEDWVRSEETPPAYQGHAPLPEINFDELVTPHVNPLLRAAAPVLMLLARLRVALLRAPFATLMGEVADAVTFFETEIRAAGLADAQANDAKYLLCATADDIVQNIPTDDRHVWTQYSMLSRFFGERLGGERFFELLERNLKDPSLNYDVLELAYTALALGFQGKYRHHGQGAVELQRIQRHLYETLRRVRPRSPVDLSPNWKGQALAARKTNWRPPAWAVVAASMLGLAGLFFTLRALLVSRADAAASQVATMHATGKIDLQRKKYEPPPPPPPAPPNVVTQLQRVRAALAAEISAGDVDATQDASRIYIHVGAKALFASGQATVLPTFRPIGQRIAEALDKEPGKVNVVGHTDNVKLSPTSRFKDNQELSLERAKAVAAELKTQISDPARLAVAGKADTQPIGDNATAQGRAQNRRVDLTLERSGD